MYRRILVALKDLDGPDAVLEHAAALAELTGAILVLLHVAHTHSRDAASYLEGEAEPALEALAASLRTRGITVETLTEPGEPAEAIVRASAGGKADLVVMGAHGHHGLRHVLMGSVTESVIRDGRVPVLLVRPGGGGGA